MHNGQTEDRMDMNGRVLDSTRYMYICERISPADQFSKRCTADCTPQCLVEESKKTMCPGKKKKGEEMASEVVEGLDGG